MKTMYNYTNNYIYILYTYTHTHTLPRDMEKRENQRAQKANAWMLLGNK